HRGGVALLLVLVEPVEEDATTDIRDGAALDLAGDLRLRETERRLEDLALLAVARLLDDADAIRARNEARVVEEVVPMLGRDGHVLEGAVLVRRDQVAHGDRSRLRVRVTRGDD